MARVEIRVQKRDVVLIREIAKALSDPARASRIRTILRNDLRHGERLSFKEFLASAPLDGIELERAPNGS